MSRNQVIGALIIAAVSGSLSFGFSQMNVGSLVRVHSVELQQVKEEQVRERARTDARIFELAGLVRTVIETDRMKNENNNKTLQEFITLLRVQNELLSRKP